MRITFVLPGSSRYPVGGYKVVFEYANRLIDRGHTVTIVHPALLHRSAGWHERAYHGFRYFLWGTTQRFGPEQWFQLKPQVRLDWVYSLTEANVPDADVIVATGWPTAEAVAEYSCSKGRKFYLLQHYETWWGPEDRVRATWKLPLHKLVIARWLERIASELGEHSTYLPNGLDFEAFGCDVPIAQRLHPSVLMLSHPMEWKGTADGIGALECARKIIPDLQATLYGAKRAPRDLPSWVSYAHYPSQARLRGLYNEATAFLSPSWTEGCPAPPAEAMMCGAALVCTQIDGHLEFAVNERNSLMAPARAPEPLGEALVRMLSDHSLRQTLALTALEDISQFTWKAATDRLEAAFGRAEESDPYA